MMRYQHAAGPVRESFDTFQALLVRHQRFVCCIVSLKALKGEILIFEQNLRRCRDSLYLLNSLSFNASRFRLFFDDIHYSVYLISF